MALDMSAVDNKIIELIVEMRATYHACTARLIARQMRMDPSHIGTRLQKLKAAGLVDFNEVPGSIHLVDPTADKTVTTQPAGGRVVSLGIDPERAARAAAARKERKQAAQDKAPATTKVTGAKESKIKSR